MGRAVYLVLGVVLFALLSLGASCDDETGETARNGTHHPTPTPSAGGSADRIDRLDQVNLSDLTRSERRRWADLVNEQLSPCGEPVSVARCVQEERTCRRCVPAARYVARLVMDGHEPGKIEELYADRYGEDTVVELSADDAPIRGASMAALTIVEFSDFECPYCGATSPILKSILREFEGRVRLVFRHYPLPQHTDAPVAARATVAAANQGKFWEMHDRLFEHQDELDAAALEGHAEVLGLDMQRFRADMASEATQARVDADRELGRSVEVEGTPTIFVNGRRFQEEPRSLPIYIREELEL